MLAATRVAPVLGWSAALIVVVVIAALVLASVRRRALRKGQESATPLTLHDLRTLHARGEVSDEEFESLRAVILRSATAGGGGAPGGPASESGDPQRKPGERRAPPGFDLTGEPLPPAADGPGPSPKNPE